MMRRTHRSRTGTLSSIAAASVRRSIPSHTLVAVSVAGLTLALGAFACTAQPTTARRGIPTASEGNGPERPGDGALIAAGDILATVSVGDRPQGVALGFGSVWVANHGDKSVSRIDPRTNTVEATLAVGDGPARIVVGFGSVWVAHDREDGIWRVDPHTNRAARILVGGRVSGTPAVGLGGVWVTIWEDHSVARIDPATDRVTLRIAGPENPLGVQIARGSLWVASSRGGRGRLTRIDPVARSVLLDIPLGVLPWFQGPSAGPGELWVADGYQGAVRRLDLDTLRVTTVLPRGEMPMVFLGPDGVWIHQSNGLLLQLDRETNRILEAVTVSDGPAGLAVGEGSVWVTGFREQALWRLRWRGLGGL